MPDSASLSSASTTEKAPVHAGKEQNSDSSSCRSEELHTLHSNEELTTPLETECLSRVSSVPGATRCISRASAAPEPPESMFLQNKAEAWWFVVIGALATCVSSITIPIYFPALTVLADNFHTTLEMINTTATIYSVFQGLSPLFWATISDRIGRRPVFLVCITVNFGANIGLAFCNTYWTLFGLRILQASGGAATVSLAYGLVGDITQRKTRGGYVGILGGLGLLGNCFGPIIGGALMARWGWRAIFWFLVILAGVTLLLIAVALPETARHLVGRGTIWPKSIFNQSPYIIVRRAITGYPSKELHEDADSWMPPPRKLNPFGFFHLLAQLDVWLILVPMSLMYTVWYMSLTAQSTLLSSQYQLTTAQVGYTYLSSGVGTIFASLLAGRLMQRMYASMYAKHTARSVQERGRGLDIYRARLGYNFYAMGLMVATVLVFAWTIEYKVPFYVPVVMTFFVSATSTFVQATANALLIDLFPDDSATAVGCSNLTRCLLCAAGLAVVQPMIDGISTGPAFTILAGLVIISALCFALLFKKGMALAERRLEKEIAAEKQKAEKQ